MTTETLQKIDIKVNYQQALIEFDNSELVKLAQNTIAKYKDLVVTPDIVADIKKEVAGINNIIKDIDAKRISVSKDYTAPLKAFEVKIKEVTAILENTAVDLKKQLQVFEDQRRAEVKKFLDIIILNFNKEYNLADKYYNQIKIHEHYYNKTAKPAEVQADIKSQFELLAQSAELEQLKLDQAKQEAERLAIEQEQRIKTRYELIATLNKQFNVEFNFDELKTKTDAQVAAFYAQDFEKKQKQIAAEEKATKATVQQIAPDVRGVEPIPELKPKSGHTLTITNLTTSDIDLIIKSVKIKMPHASFKMGIIEE